MTNISDIWDYIIDNGLASEEALRLVTNINGYNEDTLNDVIYSKTGYRDLEQLKNEES
jgi:hypothetical protein